MRSLKESKEEKNMKTKGYFVILMLIKLIRKTTIRGIDVVEKVKFRGLLLVRLSSDVQRCFLFCCTRLNTRYQTHILIRTRSG